MERVQVRTAVVTVLLHSIMRLLLPTHHLCTRWAAAHNRVAAAERRLVHQRMGVRARALDLLVRVREAAVASATTHQLPVAIGP